MKKMVNNNTKAFLIIALLLCSSLSYAIRPDPGFASAIPSQTQHGDAGFDAEQVEVVNESCEGVGEEECLFRRTLVAHTDYIYTQKHKP